VHKVDRDGRVLASFGRGRGEGDGELFDPRSASLSTLRAYVADWVRERGRVHAFAPDGSHLGTWSIGDDGQWLRSPQGLAVDTQGRLVVADRDLPAPMTTRREP
jgi:sugar lactone lactonase YvrE